MAILASNKRKLASHLHFKLADAFQTGLVRCSRIKKYYHGSQFHKKLIDESKKYKYRRWNTDISTTNVLRHKVSVDFVLLSSWFWVDFVLLYEISLGNPTRSQVTSQGAISQLIWGKILPVYGNKKTGTGKTLTLKGCFTEQLCYTISYVKLLF